MVLPRLEAEAEWGQLREAFAEFRVENEVRRHDPRCETADRLVAVPCHAVAEPAHASSGSGDLGFQQCPHGRANTQIAAGDDAFGNTAGTVATRRAHRRNAGNEFD